MRETEEEFRTDWAKLGPSLSRAATKIINSSASCEYQGLNFYGSYDPAKEGDKKLHRWATTVVDTFPGVDVSIVPRQKRRSPPRCPVCHGKVSTCPVCAADMRGTEEKGVDVRMATTMISLAWAENYDIAVLVSSDRDFAPVAEFLKTKGIKVIHGAFPPSGKVALVPARDIPARAKRVCRTALGFALLRYDGFVHSVADVAGFKSPPWFECGLLSAERRRIE